MPTPTAIIPAPPLLGVQITLAAKDTNYNLLALLQAVDPSFPAMVNAFQIQVDPASPSGNLFIGDAKMSTTAPKRYGFEIVPTASTGFWFTPNGDVERMPLGAFFLNSSVDAAVINILSINT